MLQEVVSIFTDSIRACNSWFISILEATTMTKLVVGFICIFLSARFILKPIVGGAFFRSASDKVKKSSIGEKE